jgi:hypothetical protein
MATTDPQRASPIPTVPRKGKRSTKTTGYLNYTLAIAIIGSQVLLIFWTAKSALADLCAWIGETHLTYWQTHKAGPADTKSLDKAQEYLEESVALRPNYASYRGTLAEIDLDKSDLDGMDQESRDKFVAQALNQYLAAITTSPTVPFYWGRAAWLKHHRNAADSSVCPMVVEAMKRGSHLEWIPELSRRLNCSSVGSAGAE